MRTFIAIELPGEIKEALAGLVGRLRQSDVRASWVTPERMHLTLRFLGEIETVDAEKLGELLAARYAALKPFTLRVAGTGAFPSLGRPSVVWVGVGPLVGGLADAQSIAEEGAWAIGAAPEKKPFHPHLTLGRVRDDRALEPLVERLKREDGFDAGEFAVRAVSLFSSQLRPQGPIYRPLGSFPFGKD